MRLFLDTMMLWLRSIDCAERIWEIQKDGEGKLLVTNKRFVKVSSEVLSIPAALSRDELSMCIT